MGGGGVLGGWQDGKGAAGCLLGCLGGTGMLGGQQDDKEVVGCLRGCLEGVGMLGGTVGCSGSSSMGQDAGGNCVPMGHRGDRA